MRYALFQSRTAVFALIFTCVTVTWTDRFTSFDNAKLAVLLLSVPIVLIVLSRGDAQRTKRFPTGISLILAGICVSGVLHALLNRALPAATVSAHTLRAAAMVGFAAILIADVEVEDRAERVRKILMTASIPVVALAWIQYAGLAPSLFPVIPGYDQRVYSVFGNQNLLGGFLAVCMMLPLHTMIQSKRVTAGGVVFFAVCSATCALTGSRTAWLAAAASFIAVSPDKYKSKPLAICALVGIALAWGMMAFFPEVTVERVRHTFSGIDDGWHIRLWIWTAATTLVQSHGLTGIGPGDFAMTSPQALGNVLHSPGGSAYHSNTIHTWYAHSTPLDLLLDYGIIGGMMCAAWVVTLVRGRKSPLFGPAVAFSLYALFNSVTPSIPHTVAGLLIFTAISGDTKNDRPKTNMNTPGFIIMSKLVYAPCAVLLTIMLIIPDYQLAGARAVFAESGDPADAHETYALAAQHRFAKPETHLEYAILLYETDASTSLEHLNVAADGLDTGELHLMRSRTHAALGNDDAALEHARLATHRWPRDASAWSQRLSLEGENVRRVWLFEARTWLSESEWGRIGAELQLGDR